MNLSLNFSNKLINVHKNIQLYPIIPFQLNLSFIKLKWYKGGVEEKKISKKAFVNLINKKTRG